MIIILLIGVQGEIQVYGSMAELEEKGFDSTQLLRLVKTDEQDDDTLIEDRVDLSNGT